MLWMLEHIQITDIIDIFILAYVMYRAFLLLQGTQAVQSLVGLGFLLLLYAMAKQFELHSIYWLLDKFIVYLVLAIIILFQEDIRRGLAKAGRLVPSIQREQAITTVQELIKVSFALAARRIGGLIAIERQAPLGEYIVAATPLDAYVSQELLTTIFLPTSPLHDGAVVIQQDRIAAAQVFLPLSSSKTLSKIYGTRHRAALGLSEITDAIVIVISEQRGTVGIAQNGTFLVVHDANEMRQKLQEALDSPAIEASAEN